MVIVLFLVVQLQVALRDGPVNLGGGGSGRMTSEQFYYLLLQ